MKQQDWQFLGVVTINKELAENWEIKVHFGERVFDEIASEASIRVDDCERVISLKCTPANHRLEKMLSLQFMAFSDIEPVTPERIELCCDQCGEGKLVPEVDSSK